MRWLRILIIASTSLASCTSPINEEERQKIGCDILVDWANKRFAGAASGFTLLENPVPIPPMDVQATIKALEGDNLSVKEIRREVEEHNRVLTLKPATTCPALATILQCDPFISRGSTRALTIRSLQLTVPYVDLDRGVAYFSVEYACGALCGEQSTIYYKRRRKGDWQFDFKDQHVVS